MFAKPIYQSSVGGKREFKTGCGACLNVCLTIVTLMFFVNYYVIMVLRKDINIMTSVEHNSPIFDEDYEFKMGQGDRNLMIAVALMDRNGESGSFDDILIAEPYFFIIKDGSKGR